jgi:hypothetical protein
MKVQMIPATLREMRGLAARLGYWLSRDQDGVMGVWGRDGLMRLAGKMSTTQSRPDPPPINERDRRWALVYGQLIERYQHLPAEVSSPYMAVRLVVKRYGFDEFLAGLMLKGVPWMTEKARAEMTKRQEFVVRMMSEWPPEDPADVEGAAQEMAEELAGLEGEAGQKRLFGFLERLRKLEWMRNLRHARVGALLH